MRYEINIAQNGQHIARVTLRTDSESDAITQTIDFMSRFPESEGFGLCLSRWEEIGRLVEIKTPLGWEVAG